MSESNLGINISGNVIQIVVGEDETTFNVHENVIKSCSPFFEAALSKSWLERKRGRVDLPEDDAEIVQLYLQFLYSSHLAVHFTNDSIGIQLHENLPEYHTLAHLYVFGEKVRDVTFKNAVLDSFIRRINTRTNDGVRWSPVGEVVDIIYKGTLPGSMARALMLDCHCLKAREHWIGEQPDSNNLEFLTALTRFLLRERDRRHLLPDPLHNPFEEAIPRRLYHEGADGKPIVTRKNYFMGS